jgi:hypothetical protein
VSSYGSAAVMWVQTGTALPLSYRSPTELRAGLEPATCRLRVDNRTCVGPQQNVVVAVVECGRDADLNRRPVGPSQITEPLRPATIVCVVERQAHQESNPDQRGWSSRCSPLHHGPAKADEEPPAGVEPAPQPYEGCVLPLTPQRRGSGDGRSRTCIPSVQARCSRPLSYVPVDLGDAKGDRPDSNRHREDHDLECCRYTTVTRKKAGTTGFEPATTRSTTERSGRAELRPLARACVTMKAEPPRRSTSFIVKQTLKVRGWDSNPRSRAHEAREDSLSSTAHLPGWSRTSGLRFPKPAGWPSPLRAVGLLTRSTSPRRAAPRPSRRPPPDAGRRSRSPDPRSRTRRRRTPRSPPSSPRTDRP